MSTLNPSMEDITIPGSISGSSIVRDICNRLSDKLSRDCSLRSVDVYSGYSFRVTVEIQLRDVYPVDVVAIVAEGRIDPKVDVLQLELGSDVAAQEPEANNLERPVDEAGVVEAAPVRQRRYFTPLNGTQPLEVHPDSVEP